MLLPLVFGLTLSVRPPELAKWWALGGTSLSLLRAGCSSRASTGRRRISSRRRAARVPARSRHQPLSASTASRAAHRSDRASRAHLRPRLVDRDPGRQRLFYGWLSILQAAMIGVFAARDLAFFYICFEFTLLPCSCSSTSSAQPTAARPRSSSSSTPSPARSSRWPACSSWPSRSRRRRGRDVGFTLDIGVLTEHAPTC